MGTLWVIFGKYYLMILNSDHFLKKIFEIGIFLLISQNTQANYVQNGDFENGKIEPWYCSACHCEPSKKFLELSGRNHNWAGPRQSLSKNNFLTNDNLQVAFNFSIRSPESLTATWKVRVTNSGETKYFTLLKQIVNHQDWEHVSEPITLPTFLIGCDEVEFYLEVIPENASYDIDTIRETF